MRFGHKEAVKQSSLVALLSFNNRNDESQSLQTHPEVKKKNTLKLQKPENQSRAEGNVSAQVHLCERLTERDRQAETGQSSSMRRDRTDEVARKYATCFPIRQRRPRGPQKRASAMTSLKMDGRCQDAFGKLSMSYRKIQEHVYPATYMNKVTELTCTGCISKLTCARGNITHRCYMSAGDVSCNTRVSIPRLYKITFFF